MHKSRSEYRDGYKAHIAIEPETGLVTSAIFTPANVSDAKTALDLMAIEPDGLEVLADSAYGSGQTRAHLRAHGHRQVIKPIPLRRAIPGGFSRDDFVIDHVARTATCPAGITVAIAQTRRPLAPSARAARYESAAPHHRVASRRSSIPMTTSSWRPVVNGEQGDGLEEYRRWRPMVERSIAWLVANGNRRVRFRGVERNQLGLSHRVAALNLRRLVNLGLVNDGRWQLRPAETGARKPRSSKWDLAFGPCPSRVAGSNPFSRRRFGRTYLGLHHELTPRSAFVQQSPRRRRGVPAR